jgi:hypothetical protein
MILTKGLLSLDVPLNVMSHEIDDENKDDRFTDEYNEDFKD